MVELYGPDNKPIPKQKDKFAICPQCGRGPKDRVPSGGFGRTWYVCKCGFEFNRELTCPSVTP